MKVHVAKVSSACYYHLRWLRQICCHVGAEVMTQLVLARVMSRLDYCNAILASVPQSTLEPLQRVKNAAARLAHQLDIHNHVTPSVMVLHWLPIRCRSDFKLCMIMYGIHTGIVRPGCLQIQPNKFPGDFQEISRTHLTNFQ